MYEHVCIFNVESFFWNNYNFPFYNGFIIINVIVVYNLMMYQVNDREKINIPGARAYGTFFSKKCATICIRLFNRWKIVQGLDRQFYHENVSEFW